AGLSSKGTFVTSGPTQTPKSLGQELSVSMLPAREPFTGPAHESSVDLRANRGSRAISLAFAKITTARAEYFRIQASRSPEWNAPTVNLLNPAAGWVSVNGHPFASG